MTTALAIKPQEQLLGFEIRVWEDTRFKTARWCAEAYRPNPMTAAGLRELRRHGEHLWPITYILTIRSYDERSARDFIQIAVKREVYWNPGLLPSLWLRRMRHLGKDKSPIHAANTKVYEPIKQLIGDKQIA